MDSSKYGGPYSLAQDLFLSALLCWKIHIYTHRSCLSSLQDWEHGCWRWHFVPNLSLPLWSSVATSEGRRMVTGGHGAYAQKAGIL